MNQFKKSIKVSELTNADLEALRVAEKFRTGEETSKNEFSDMIVKRGMESLKKSLEPKEALEVAIKHLEESKKELEESFEEAQADEEEGVEEAPADEEEESEDIEL